MLNSIGLQNIGLRRLLRDKAPIWAGWQVPVIVNIAAETLEEFDRLAAALEDVPGIAGLEVNLSCPNADQGGVEFGSNPAMAATVTQRVRRATTLPVIVKLTPNVADIRDEARAVEDAGADAITVANTLYGLAIDVESRSTVMPWGVAGLSGPAIKPIASITSTEPHRPCLSLSSAAAASPPPTMPWSSSWRAQARYRSAQ